MTVIINDFQVVAEPAHNEQTTAPAEPGQAAPTAQQASTAGDVERILRRLSERLERIQAM